MGRTGIPTLLIGVISTPLPLKGRYTVCSSGCIPGCRVEDAWRKSCATLGPGLGFRHYGLGIGVQGL